MFLSKRKGIYYVFYTNDSGKRTCISTKANLKSEALKFLSGFKDELAKRKAQKTVPINLKDFANEFRSHSALVHSYKTGKDYQSVFNKLLKTFGNIPLTELTENKLSDYLKARNQISVYTSAKDLRYFRSAFNYAINQKYLLVNPCSKIKTIKAPERQPLFISAKDYETLLAVIDDKLIKDIVIFAINTGLRLMEILTLEWNQINFKDRYVILDNVNHITKSKRIRSVPLNINALQVLTERERETKGNFVFSNNEEILKGDFVSKKFKKYIIKANLNPKLKFHSLRHSFASWLVQKGISIYQVSQLLGHSDLKVTQIYSHLTPDNLKSAVDILNQ
jgi:integrase